VAIVGPPRRSKQVTTTAYRGVVQGGVVLLDKEASLTEGTEVLVMPLVGASGSPAAVLAAMENAPKIPAQWVDELERLIAEGHQPPAPPISFSDDLDNQESS